MGSWFCKTVKVNEVVVVALRLTFSLVSGKYLLIITNDVAFKVIKVDLTPTVRTVIYKSNASVTLKQVLDVPAFTIHSLAAVSNLVSDNLKTHSNLCLVRVGIC